MGQVAQVDLGAIGRNAYENVSELKKWEELRCFFFNFLTHKLTGASGTLTDSKSDMRM